MKTVLLILVTIVCPVLAQTDRVKLFIEMTNDSYTEGETVYLIASLENKGSQDISFDGFSLEAEKLQLNVIREDGRKVPYLGPIYHIINPTKETLPAHGKISIGIMIDYYYPTFRDPDAMYRKITPGKYTVRANFSIGVLLVESNELTFRVKPAKGRDEEALKELERVYIPENYFSHDSAKVIRVYKGFLSRYADSPYTPFISNEIVWTYQKEKDTARASEALKQLVRMYPNHGYALNAMQSRYLTPKEKQALLTEIISKHPLGVFARHARNLRGVKESLLEMK